MNTSLLPNSPQALTPKTDSGLIPIRRVWGMLAMRSAVSFGLLLLVGLGFAAAGLPDPISRSAGWWLWYVTAAGAVSIILLVRFGRMEGLHLRELYNVNRSTWKGDLLWLFIGLLVTVVVAQLPGTWLAGQLWGNSSYPNDLLFQPLPLAAVYPLFVLMPIIHGLAELPVYWGYVAPRLRAWGMNRWVVIFIVGTVLSVQHMFFSFQPDWRYNLWLAVKFLPFAMWTGVLIDRRPTVLPYMMAIHILMDALLPYLLFLRSTGVALSL